MTDFERVADDDPDTNVVGLCRDLIRIDTSNFAERQGPGERAAAELLADRLRAVGLEPEFIEASPGRTNLVARWRGTSSSRDALLLHGHLDVVPAEEPTWTHDPFGGDLADGLLWGRGAVDMKNMLAMIVATVEQRIITGRPPARDVVLAFFADEEAGSRLGSQYLVAERPEIFAGVTEAISEVGGFSITVGRNERAYFIETARKGVAWFKAVAEGTAGHGSLHNAKNAVARLAAAVARIGEHDWPHRPSDTSERMIEELSRLLGVTLDPEQLDLSGTPLAPVAGLIESSLRHTANPTVISGGNVINLVPQNAHAYIDGRFVPGFEREFMAAVEDLLGAQVQVDLYDRAPASESSPNANIVEAMRMALLLEDPGSQVIPYCNAASTDNAHLATLGIAGYGFVPLKLPPGFDFASMFHGVDERIPVESLNFGVRTLDRFLDLA